MKGISRSPKLESASAGGDGDRLRVGIFCGGREGAAGFCSNGNDGVTAGVISVSIAAGGGRAKGGLNGFRFVGSSCEGVSCVDDATL